MEQIIEHGRRDARLDRRARRRRSRRSSPSRSSSAEASRRADRRRPARTARPTRPGVKPGDILVAVDGKPVTDPATMLDTVAALVPGSQATPRSSARDQKDVRPAGRRRQAAGGRSGACAKPARSGGVAPAPRERRLASPPRSLQILLSASALSSSRSMSAPKALPVRLADGLHHEAREHRARARTAGTSAPRAATATARPAA